MSFCRRRWVPAAPPLRLAVPTASHYRRPCARGRFWLFHRFEACARAPSCEVDFFLMLLWAGLLSSPSTSSLSLLAHQVNCLPMVLPLTLSISTGSPPCMITLPSSA